MNATLCIKDCPVSATSEYKFKIIDINNKTCYSICPPERPNHKGNIRKIIITIKNVQKKHHLMKK